MQSCEDLVEGNVKKTVESGVYQQYLVEKAAQDLEDDKQAKRDEWRKKAAACKAAASKGAASKAAASKAGGEAQFRETKTKASFTNQYSDMFNFLFVLAILITTNFVYVKICILALKVYIHIGAALINRFFSLFSSWENVSDIPIWHVCKFSFELLGRHIWWLWSKKSTAFDLICLILI